MLVTGALSGCQKAAETPADGETNTETTMEVTVEGTEEDDAAVTVDEVKAGEDKADDEGTSTSEEEKANVVDGTYKSTQTYDSPAGLDEITVSVTVKNGIVTAVSSSATAKDATSLGYQQNFNSNIQGLVVGKSLSDLGSFSTISGASLTTPAFNAALDAVRSQAKA